MDVSPRAQWLAERARGPRTHRAVRPAPAPSHPSWFKHRLIRIALWAVGLYVLLLYVVPQLVPLPGELNGEANTSTVITDENGRPLRQFLVNGEKVVSDYATLAEIPEDLINATIAAEDKRFWDHGGIDFPAVARAVFDGVRHRELVSGASTITQQLIKISSPPSKRRGLTDKVYEATAARKVEMRHDKRWILENYINRLPYGNLRHGCRAAAEGYFGKPLKDLSLAECAYLAGLPNKPTRFNPYTNPEGARTRQRWILDRMLEDGYVTEAQHARAKKERLVIVKERSAFRAPHAVDLIVEQHPEALKPGRVRSTLNLEMQAFAEQALDQQLDFIAGKRETSPYLHAAVVAIENETGNVRILTGSRDYFSGRSGQVNGAWTPRSPGSALKPITYLLAIEKGIPASTVLADVPAEFMTATGMYRPVNYDRTFRGPVRIRYALGNSLNIPAVRALEMMGGVRVLYDGLQSLGITTLNQAPEMYGLGLTIGNAEMRLLEVTNAYACVARMGEWRPYRLLADEPIAKSKRLFSEESCYIIADMMSDPAARAQTFGWITPLRFENFRAAAKTGTSSDYRDAWTVGFTPRYTVGVWLGNFDNSSLDHFSGAAGAGPIFHAVLAKLESGKSPRWYEKPASVEEISVDPMTGRQVTASFRPRETAKELVRRTHLPVAAAPADYDSQGRPLLSPQYRAWLEGSPEVIRNRLALADAEDAHRSFRITSPLPGMVIYLDPDLADGGKFLRLATDRSAQIHWTSPTLTIDPARPVATLTPGDHEVIAEDPATGLKRTVQFVVKRL